MDSQELWRNHYESQFANAARLLDEIIEGGETNAFRVFNILQRRLNEITPSTAIGDDGKSVFQVKKAQTPDSESMLPSNRPAFYLATLLGKPMRVSWYVDVHGQAGRFLTDYLSNHPDIQAVVELGSGTGLNIFHAYFSGCPSGVRWYAAEQSESGRDITRRIAELEPNLDVRVQEFDLTNPDFSWLKEPGPVLFLTNLSIMFVPQIGTELFRLMASAAPAVTGIHFENFGFQITEIDYEVSQHQKAFFMKNGWNMDLLDVLKQCRDAGLIRIEYLAKDMILNDDPYNPASLAVWHKA